MRSANERQVGGDHYKGAEYQHWDLVTDLRVPYLPARACCYTCRWRRKNGTEDLEKAIHYLDKIVEKGVDYVPPHTFHNLYWRYVRANAETLTLMDAEILYLILQGQWATAKAAVEALLSQTALDDRTT